MTFPLGFTRRQDGPGRKLFASHVNELQVALEALGPPSVAAGDADTLPTVVGGQVVWQSRERVNLQSHLVLDGSDESAAMNALVAAGSSGVVYTIPNGKTLGMGSAQLAITGKPHTRIEGYEGAMMQWAAASANPLIEVANSAFFGIDRVELVGAETAYVQAQSTRYALRLTDCPDAWVADVSINGTSRGANLLRCDRAIVERFDYLGFITTEVGIIDANFHTGLEISDSDDTQLARINARNCGSLLLIGGNSNRGVVSQVDGRNLFDNGIYLSSGDGWKIFQPVLVNDTLESGNAGVKLRGSHHLLIGGHIEKMGTGYVLTGGDVDLGGGYSGIGSKILTSAAKGCSGNGLQITQQGSFKARDFVAAFNTFDGCGAGLGAVSTVLVNHGDYHRLSSNEILNHLGTQPAEHIVGASGFPLVGIRVDNETIRNVAGGASAYGFQSNFVDQLLVTGMTLHDITTALYGMRLANTTSSRVTGTRKIGTAGTAQTIRVNDVASTNNVIINNPGCTISDVGTGTIKPQTYAATNVTTDRTFDADTVAVAELADIVGTLVADLRAQGIVV